MSERDPFDPFEDGDEDSGDESFDGSANPHHGSTPADHSEAESVSESEANSVSDSASNSAPNSTPNSTGESAPELRHPDLGGGKFLYEETTEEVRVIVRPVFLDDQSEPEEHRYLWAYHIRIENESQRTVQLLTRQWKITDADGRLHTVEGAGVVGEQPTLVPGGSFEYTSGTPLRTPSGFMAGSYEMRRDDGARFRVVVPTFSLDSPYAEARLLH